MLIRNSCFGLNSSEKETSVVMLKELYIFGIVYLI